MAAKIWCFVGLVALASPYETGAQAAEPSWISCRWDWAAGVEFVYTVKDTQLFRYSQETQSLSELRSKRGQDGSGQEVTVSDRAIVWKLFNSHGGTDTTLIDRYSGKEYHEDSSDRQSAAWDGKCVRIDPRPLGGKTRKF